MQIRQDDRETTDQIHNVSHQLSTEHSRNTCRTTAFSPSFPSPSIGFLLSPNKVPGRSAGSGRCQACDRVCGRQAPIVRCPGMSVCEWCVSASCVSRGTRQWSLTRGADNQSRGMPFSRFNPDSWNHLSCLKASRMSGCLCRYIHRDEQLDAWTAGDLCPSGGADGGQRAQFMAFQTPFNALSLGRWNLHLDELSRLSTGPTPTLLK